MSSEEERTHTALHVVKGAVQKVLGATLTTSVYVSGSHGRLTVRFDRKPSPEEMERVEEAANRKVDEGVEVVEFEMEREEAQMHFGEQIYDEFPVPEGITMLRLVRIPDWNVNCCNEKHVDSTAAVGRVRLGAARYRNAKGEVEVEFDLVE
ncbi:MAG: alanyl-tRNA editing protein [archaeon]|nr:MAG: alanyl-tRNA editing protein [archaeon]